MTRQLAAAWNLSCAGFLIAAFCAGCATRQQQIRDALLNDGPQHPETKTSQPYCIGCPDVIRLNCPQRPDLGGIRLVEANGCIAVPALGGVRVEGLTSQEAEVKLASMVHLDPHSLHVEVTEYRRQQVYLFGEVSGLQRAIPYQGPETVVEMLRRAGGVTQDGAPTQLRVVRNPPVPGAAPQVFRVDLQAILLRGDNSTNVVVQPYDQIYVPESKQARFGKCLHPLLQKCWNFLSGTM